MQKTKLHTVGIAGDIRYCCDLINEYNLSDYLFHIQFNELSSIAIFKLPHDFDVDNMWKLK